MTGDGRLSPAMERWRVMMEGGYSVRPALRPARNGYLEWGPGLFGPDGEFVRHMRRDVFRRLVKLGILVEPGGKGDE